MSPDKWLDIQRQTPYTRSVKKGILFKNLFVKGLPPTLHGQYGGKGNRAAHQPHDHNGHGVGGLVERDEFHGDGIA